MKFFKKKSGTKENAVGQKPTAYKIPNHVAIIMDGNGRWATLRGKERAYGHKVGARNLSTILSHAFRSGVKTVSLYVFSSDNFRRPKDEVDKLFSLITDNYFKHRDKLIENGVKLYISGDITALPEKARDTLTLALKETSGCDRFNLNLAINYNGRSEIVKAVNELVSRGENVTEESISTRLYTADLGDPELVIRTSGEQRLSGFMLYQTAYSELYFTEVLWPDFNEEEFDKALLSYSNRNRRFGGLTNE